MKEITSIEITNPIEIGSSVTAKTFSLDIRLILNQSTVINLEMQVLNKGFWPERSIGYLATLAFWILTFRIFLLNFIALTNC